MSTTHTPQPSKAVAASMPAKSAIALPALNPANAPRPNAKGAVFITSADQLDYFYFRFNNLGKSQFLKMAVYDLMGQQIAKFRILVEDVNIEGPRMPFLDMRKAMNGKPSFDGGVTSPSGVSHIDMGNKAGELARAFIAKVDDALIEFVYKLQRPNAFIRKIERVPIAGKKPTFTPRVYYSDGTVVDIDQQVVKPIGKTPLEYFVFSQTDDNIYFTEFSIMRKNKFVKDKLYLDFAFDIPVGQFSMKRKKNEEGTIQQADPSTWGIIIPKLVNADGTWKVDRTAGNMYSKIKCITAPHQRSFFKGNLSLEVDAVWPGEGYTLKLNGSASLISEAGADDNSPYEDMEEGLVASSSSMPAKGAAAAQAGEELDAGFA